MPRIPLRDLKRAIEEQRRLSGLFVDNVYQCDPRCFLLKLKPGKLFLLIDVNPGRARVLVTDEPPPVPDRPPMFGAILRHALRGGRLQATSLLAEDRIVAIDVGDHRLVVEALPRHGNLLLLDAEQTVERVLDGEAGRRRNNTIGSAYTLPKAPVFREEESLLEDDLEDTPFAGQALGACCHCQDGSASSRSHGSRARIQAM